MYNVRMPNGGHDLHLPPDADEVGFRLDLTLLDCLDGHLLSRLFVDAQLDFSIRALA